MTRLNTVLHIHGEKTETVCPVCNFVYRDDYDLSKIIESGACTECFTNFRHIFGEDWGKGKRPDMELARSKMFWKA